MQTFALLTFSRVGPIISNQFMNFYFRLIKDLLVFTQFIYNIVVQERNEGLLYYWR